MLSVISGVIAYLIGYTLFFLVSKDVSSILKDIVVTSYTSLEAPKEALREELAVVEILEPILYILLPISAIIQGGILGGLLGLLYSYLIASKGVKPLYSALITGSTHIVALELLPLIVVSTYLPQLTKVLIERLGLVTLVAPGTIYTIILAFTSSFEGPWKKWVDSTPTRY